MNGPLPRILVVENNSLSARIDHAILSGRFDVTVVCGGVEAVALSDADPAFDLAIVSLSLPDMGALEVAGLIRERSGGRTVATALASRDRPRLLGQRGEWAAFGTTSILVRPLTVQAIADLLSGAVTPTRVDRSLPNFEQFARLCRPGVEDLAHRLRRAVRSLDMDSIRGCAHEVLGYCGLLQLPELAAACRTVEEAVEANLHATAVRAVDVLLVNLDELVELLVEAEKAADELKMGGYPDFQSPEELAASGAKSELGE